MDPASESKWFEEEAPAESAPTESAPAGPRAGYRDARVPALIAQVALALNPLLYVAVFGIAFAEGIVRAATGATIGVAHALTVAGNLVELPLRLATTAAFLWWVYRASKNSFALSEVVPEYGSGFALLCWFIPCAHLWLPYQVVGEIDRKSDASGTGQTSSLVTAWWLAWVGFLVTAQIYLILGAGLFVFVMSLAQIAAAILAILVIRRIQKNQIALATRPDTQAIAAQFE